MTTDLLLHMKLIGSLLNNHIRQVKFEKQS